MNYHAQSLCDSGGLTLSDGEHRAFRGWGTLEDRVLRNMSLSVGVMVKRGTQTNFFFGPKNFSNMSLTIFSNFEILSDINWSHSIFGAIFGKIGGCFR